MATATSGYVRVVAQNVYDDESFFEGYSKLPRSVEGLDGAPEWQVLRSMLPPLNGRKVLDLGCGFGWFCRWAMSEQASRVVGIDLSERMLDRARQGTARGMIEYRQADLDGVVLPAGLFDLVYSSLTLHYVIDLDRLLKARAGRSVGWAPTVGPFDELDGDHESDGEDRKSVV